VELLTKIHRYVSSNKDFYEYYRSKTSARDEDLFVRRTYKNIVRDDCCLINFDSKPCTSHDFSVATIIVNDMFTSHLEYKLEKLEGNLTTKGSLSNKKICWTGTKVEFAEKVYGYYHNKMFNHGNVGIKEIARMLSIVFNFAIDDKTIYRCLQNIKEREPRKAIFLYNFYNLSNNKFGEDHY
jgi:hypothetical protein